MPGNLAQLLANRMGNSCSRHKSKARRDRTPETTHTSTDRQPSNPEDEELKALRSLIQDRPHVFILNNLLLSIRLFTHYEKEIEKARREVTTRESTLNEQLLPEKTATIPDVLHEHFNGKIRFTSFCKFDKDEQTIEPLRPIKIYINYVNVLVTETDESRHYSSPNELRFDYTFFIKQTEHKGYVRLEQPTESSLKRTGVLGSDNTDLSSIAENRDEIYSEDESMYGGQNGTANSMPNLLDEEIYLENSNSLRPDRVSNICTPSSSSSGYTTNYTIDSDSDSSGLGLARHRNFLDSSEIPAKCFKTVTYMYNGRIYNPKREQKTMTSQQRRIRDAKLAHNYDVVYVNGYNFAKHFYYLFKHKLADRIHFDKSVVKNAKRTDATIRMEKIAYSSADNFVSIEQYEVIPCFTSPWPKWSLGWMNRSRSSWPNYDDILAVNKFGCYLVPESLRPFSLNKPQNQTQWKLDWSIAFPAAERYLETCLSQTQMTVYAIALMIHKTFIRNAGTSFGLGPDHIRNLLFWMVETQPNWSELEMGKYLVKLLESLHNHIQQRSMPDYFMHERNIFFNANADDTSHSHLLHSQKQLKRIIENPVMFIFHAMEKIQYQRNEYPRLDFKELFKLLTINELILMNPNLCVKSQTEFKDTGEFTISGYGKRDGERKFWSEARQTNQYYMKTRKTSINTLINPKQNDDSIIDIQEKCEPLTTIRLTFLLIFFSEHFIEIARCCHKLGAVRQKNVYLAQTKLLALLLADNPDEKQKSEDLLAEVRELAEDVVKPQSVNDQNDAPETPKRNADMPLFTKSLNDRYGYSCPTVIEEYEASSNSDANASTLKAMSNSEEASRHAKTLKPRVVINDEVKNSSETTSF